MLLATRKSAMAESIMISGMKYLQTEYEMLYLLGVAYALSGKHSAAARVFQEGLKLIEEKLSRNQDAGDENAYAALFHARLRQAPKAVAFASEAAKLGSTNEDVVLKIARVYAVLGLKEKMVEWFKRARGMNPEYDAAYLTTAMDFENYRQDPDLLAVARQE